MAQLTAWLDVVARDSQELRESVSSSLSEAGIQTSDYRPDLNGITGIVALEQISPETLARVSTVSKNSRERVLTLRWGRGALPGSEAWKLLDAGASDVLSWDGSREVALQVAARLERWDLIDGMVCSPVVREKSGWRQPGLDLCSTSGCRTRAFFRFPHAHNG